MAKNTPSFTSRGSESRHIAVSPVYATVTVLVAVLTAGQVEGLAVVLTVVVVIAKAVTVEVVLARVSVVVWTPTVRVL